MLVDAQARRVQTEKELDGQYRATAVEFSYGGEVYTVKANEEIILSAGYASGLISRMSSGILTIL